MAVDPKSLNDPKLVRGLLKNADRAGMSELVLNCQVRLAELAGEAFDDQLEREFWSAVAMAEEIASQKNGKSTRLSRTRQKAKRVGIEKCLADWSTDPGTTQGFSILVEGGHAELTGEAIVIRHADKFSEAAVHSAREKLAQHGIDATNL